MLTPPLPRLLTARSTVNAAQALAQLRARNAAALEALTALDRMPARETIRP